MASRRSELARAGLGYQVPGGCGRVCGAWAGRVGVSMWGMAAWGGEGGVGGEAVREERALHVRERARRK